MLRWRRVECSSGFLLLAAGLFYLDGAGVVPWAALAALLHELGHYAAVRLQGGRLRRLRLTAVGAEMILDRRRDLTYAGELGAVLAGPAMNLLLAPAAARLGERWEGLYLLAGLSLTLGWFNLLPVYPRDGGRALMLILSGFLPPAAAERVVWCCSLTLASLVLAAGTVLLRQGGSPILLAVGAWLLAGLFQPEGSRRKTG